MSWRTVRGLTSSREASSVPVQSRGVWSSESRRRSRDDVVISPEIYTTIRNDIGLMDR